MPSSVLGESLQCSGAHICTLAYQGLLESKPGVGNLDHHRKFLVLQGNTNTGVHWGDCYCVIGASLSELHLHCGSVFVMYVLSCLRPYTVNFKYISQTLNVLVHLLGSLNRWRAMRGYCQSAVLATAAETAQVAHKTPYFLFVIAATDWPSTAGCSQTVQIIHAGLRSLMVRVAHKWHSYHRKKKWVVLTHFGYLSFIRFSTWLDNFISKVFSHDICSGKLN